MDDLVDRLTKLKESIGIPAKIKRIEILEGEVGSPDLWNDQEKARSVTQELASLKKEIQENQKAQSIKLMQKLKNYLY